MNPRVTQATCHDDFTITLTFANGEFRHFNARPYLDYPVFQPLRNPVYFQCGTVAHGTVVWPGEVDFCPDTLYLESVTLEAQAA
jgi:hypothetical protein